MATRKRRGPKIVTYILKVNEETGRVLEALQEDAMTGQRKAIAFESMLHGTVGNKIPGPHPGDKGFPSIIPVNRMSTGTNLHIRPIVTPDPPPERKLRKRR